MQRSEDGVMNDDLELIGLVENPSARRIWLLANALRSLPFDRAIELACTAEAFVTGSLLDSPTDTRVNPDPSPIKDPKTTSTTDPESTNAPDIVSSAPQ